MPTERKKQIVENLKANFKKAKAVFFTDYQGLNTNTLNRLRRKLADVDADYQVVKNTLVKIANSKIDLKGPSAALFSFGDPLDTLKILAELKRSIKRPTFKLGIFEGKIIGPEEMETLASLPNKELLITQTIQLIKSPLFSLANLLSSNQQNLVYVIKAVVDKRGGG